MSHLGKEKGIYHILYVNDFIFSLLQPPSWFICGSFFFPGLIILCSRSQSQSTTGLTTYNLVRHDLLMASGLWGRTEADTTEAT